jgi:hypothetical protein
MPTSGPFTFIVISDPQKGHHYDESKRFKYVAEAIEKEPDVLFILIGGDYNGFDGTKYWKEFFKVADGMLSKSAVFPVIGNHEYHDPIDSSHPPTHADHYHWAFDVPLNYFFDCSGVRFIVLNSPDPNNANGDDPHTSLALAQSQEQWLKEQLDSDALLGIFTMHHHPIWDYGKTQMNFDLEPWELLYHTYGISANFAGHTHNYQRYLINGIPYFVVGNAGGRFSDLDPCCCGLFPDGYKFGETRRLGYLKVTVDPANNTATAREYFVAECDKNDDKKKPTVYNKPILIDKTTFPLKS